MAKDLIEQIMFELIEKSKKVTKDIDELLGWLREQINRIYEYEGVDYYTELSEKGKKAVDILDKEFEFWEKVIQPTKKKRLEEVL